jgi:PIN domain
LVQRHGRPGSAASRIIDAIRKHEWNQTPLQLVVSVQMLDMLRHVLILHRGAEPRLAELYVEAVEDLARVGPEKLDPHLVLAGQERFPIKEREDRGVFAVAMVAMADLLVTGNLRDFLTPKCEAIETRTIKGRGGKRHLHVLHVQIHARPDGGRLLVADPVDAIAWLDEKIEITADAIRAHYAGHKRLRAMNLGRWPRRRPRMR